jgi:predicted DNA-binding ribbon-helix-helix protein
MSQKTTVYLEAESYRKLKLIARRRGCAPAMLVREAVAEYAARHAAPPRPTSVGAFRSGRKNLSERAEDLLGGFGKSR